MNGLILENKVEFNFKKIVITGAAGFIGSNLVDKFLSKGIKVIAIDNLSTGKIDFLKTAFTNDNFEFYERDLMIKQGLVDIFHSSDAVFHLAANADVRFGPENPSKDLEQNVIVTHNVLEAVRIAGVKKFIFSSTGSVYGEAEVIPTPEVCPFPIQTSLYGASKLACEGFISAYAESFDIQVWILRFVSILGPRYTHGHVLDFIKQLLLDSSELRVLGNGHQRKSYLHVDDCISAIFCALSKSDSKINIYNLGVNDACEVKDSVRWITEEMQLSPTVRYGTEKKGWIGDNPTIHLNTKKINELGWYPKYTIEESVRHTTRFILANSKYLEI